VMEYAHRMGVKAPLEANLSLALGTSGVAPLDQAAGYATLADAGIHIDPTPIRIVRDSFGTPVLDNSYPQQTEVVSAGTAYVVTSMLQSVINEGTGFPNAQIGRPAAGKTGTTSDFRDAWFVGYTPDLVAAVWIGNDNYHRMNESYGGDVPARIWARFMKAALAKTPKHDFVMPAGEVRRVTLCDTGRSEVFITGTEPSHTCGDGATPNPYVQQPAKSTGSPVKKAAAVPKAAIAPPQAPATPNDSIGDGTTFESLDSKPQAAPTP
jgi:penicillin-binding protein 1A